MKRVRQDCLPYTTDFSSYSAVSGVFILCLDRFNHVLAQNLADHVMF